MNRKDRVLLLMLTVIITATVVLAHGCGSRNNASTYPVTAGFGSTIIINPSGLKQNAAAGVTVNPVTVLVEDSFGKPQEHISITVSSGFAAPFCPSLYQFQDSAGNFLPNNFTAQTDKYGTFTFNLSIPSNVVMAQLNPPAVTLTGGNVQDAGHLPIGTYTYQVTAFHLVGGKMFETNAPTVASITTAAANSAVTVSWPVVIASDCLLVAGYNVYGNGAGNEVLMSTQTGTSFIDIGKNGIGGGMNGAINRPPATNASGFVMAPNSFTDIVDVRSGTAFGSMDISFNQ